MGANVGRTQWWRRPRVVLIALALAVPTIATAAPAPADAGPAPLNIDSWAGSTGPSASGAVSMAPTALFADGPYLFVTDYVNNVVRRFDRVAGTQQVVAGIGGSAVADLTGPLPDGVPATTAMFRQLTDLARDQHGGLVVVARGTNRIRAVSAEGLITTLAGTGASGFSGDGGPAIDATFSVPTGIAISASGDLYVADTGNNRVRRIDVAGVVTTVAGGGVGSDGGLATDAAVSQPQRVAFAPNGDLVIADTTGLRRVDHTGIISTVTALAPPADIGGLAIDPDGAIFVSTYANQVRRVDPDGSVTIIAGTGVAGLAGEGGPATAAQLDQPAGLAFDGDGSLLIAEVEGGRVLRVDAAGTLTRLLGTTYWSFSGDGGPAADAQLLYTAAITRDGAGDVFVADSLNRRIRKIDFAGVITTVAGSGPNGRDSTPAVSSGDGGPAVAATFRLPGDVAVDGAGNLYVIDLWDCVIRKVDTAGVISTLAGTKTCGSTGDGGPAADAQIRSIWVTADAAGNVYLSGEPGIRRIDPTGTITTVYGAGTQDPGDGGPATAARLSGVRKPATDPAGNLVFADRSGSRIRKIDTAGIISTVAGDGTYGFGGDGGPAIQASFRQIRGLAVAADGTVYVADMDNNRIRRIGPDGIISTIAGDGTTTVGLYGSFGGDGGPAASAHFAGPTNLVMLDDGSLLVSDLYNSRIRRMGPADLVPAHPGPEAIPLGLSRADTPQPTTTTSTVTSTTTTPETSTTSTTSTPPGDPAAMPAVVEAVMVDPTFTG